MCLYFSEGYFAHLGHLRRYKLSFNQVQLGLVIHFLVNRIESLSIPSVQSKKNFPRVRQIVPEFYQSAILFLKNAGKKKSLLFSKTVLGN